MTETDEKITFDRSATRVGRKLMYSLLWVLILVVVIEGGVRVASCLFPGLTSYTLPPFHEIERIHPYFGYQLTGRYEEDGSLSPRDTGGEVLPEIPEEGQCRVLLLGGSTAWGDGVDDELLRIPRRLQQHLNSMLDEHSLPGIESFVVINGASPGYQMRQNAAVMWSYLKYHPDFVVTLDGFNDLNRTLENKVFGQPTDFPGATWFVLDHIGSPGLKLGLWLHESAPHWWIYRHSFFCRVWINLAVTRLIGSGVTRETVEMVTKRLQDYSLSRVKDWPLAGVGHYERNLEKMAKLAQAENIGFLTVLQPYLGFPGPLTEKQKECWKVDGALLPSEEWYSVYEQLREAGKRLRRQGINWIDGTGIFGFRDTELMVDMMHANAEGQDMIARFLAENIILQLKAGSGKAR